MHARMALDTAPALCLPQIEEPSMEQAVRLCGDRLGYVHIGESHRCVQGTRQEMPDCSPGHIKRMDQQFRGLSAGG